MTTILINYNLDYLNMDEDLVARLVKEKFNGKEPKWVITAMGEVPVRTATDNSANYFVLPNGRVFYISLDAEVAQPACYACGNLALLGTRNMPELHESGGESPGAVTHKTMHNVPYCPTCEKSEAA